MPTVGDLCGGFWAGAYASPPLESYVAIAALLAEHAAEVSRSRVGGWTIPAADLVTSVSSGRSVYGYPVPLHTPNWIAADLIGGRVLTDGIDFVVSDGYVLFDEDPSTWATVRRLTWVDGDPVEVSDVLYGSVEANAPATYDPATRMGIVSAVAEACDSPASGPAEETVEVVWQGHDGVWRVVTDASTYRLVEADTPSVAVGDVLPPGTAVGSAWELTKLGPAKPDLTHLTIPASYHQGVTEGGITWYDETVNLVVDTVSSRTRVRWTLGGDEDDVVAFWEESHARGITAGATSLAQAMDTRTNPTGDPGAESLPVTVNPLEFVCQELLAGNAYLLVVYPDRFGPAASTEAERTTAVRKAAGPYVTVFAYEDEVPELERVSPA